MSNIGRALGRSWPGILLLCCSGCVSHPLIDSSPANTTVHVEATPVAGAGTTAADAAATPIAPVVSASGNGPIRDASPNPGQSAKIADRMQQLYLAAWEKAGAGPTSVFPASDAEPPSDGIALTPATTTGAAPSPVEEQRVTPRRAPHPGETVSATSKYESKSASDEQRPASKSSDPPSASTKTETVRAVQPASLESDASDQSPASSESSDAEPTNAPHSWREPMRTAAERLRAELAKPDLAPDQRTKCEAILSLLLLAEEDPEQAVSALESFDDEELEFWRRTVLGLGVLLDTNNLPKRQDRVDAAAEHMHEGLTSLTTLGRLRVRNLTLCTKVDGYGDFVECGPGGLKPGDLVALYVEVENYLVEPVATSLTQANWAANGTRRKAAATAPMYATELHGRYDIYDASGRLIATHDLPVARDECRNRRRDYYIAYTQYLPKSLTPGSYTLDLTIEDKKANKMGNAVVDFQIR